MCCSVYLIEKENIQFLLFLSVLDFPLFKYFLCPHVQKSGKPEIQWKNFMCTHGTGVLNSRNDENFRYRCESHFQCLQCIEI
jgi:hypothetical protein